jgi:DNA-binding MarR family transcriptional regulator
MEISMTALPSNAQTAAMAEIVRQFMQLAPRLKAAVPEDNEFARIRAQLYAMHSGAKPEFGDFGLFLNLGLALTQRGEPMTMGDLSRALDVPLSSATRIVDLLVKTNSVTRLPDPDDRRVVRVALTETGSAMYRALNSAIQRRVEHMLRPFTPEERETLIALLRKLVAGLEESV